MADVYAPGGNIPPPQDGAEPPPITLDANYVPESECCQVELSLANPRRRRDGRPPGGRPGPARRGRRRGPHPQRRPLPRAPSVCLPLHTLVSLPLPLRHQAGDARDPTTPARRRLGRRGCRTQAPSSLRRVGAFRGVVPPRRARRRGVLDAMNPGPVVDGGAGQEEDGGDNKPDAGDGTDAVLDPGFSPAAAPTPPRRTRR